MDLRFAIITLIICGLADGKPPTYDGQRKVLNDTEPEEPEYYPVLIFRLSLKMRKRELAHCRPYSAS